MRDLIIRLSVDQINSLIEEVRKKFPIEVCGALFGLINGREVLVKKLVFLRNILNSEALFEIDPEEFLVEFIRSENEGLQHIGFFHSHQSEAKPSEIDMEFMKLWPESIWLIISSFNYDIAAYRIINGKLCIANVKISNL